MKDPRPLINYLYEIQIENYLNTMRTSSGPEIHRMRNRFWSRNRHEISSSPSLLSLSCLIIHSITSTSTILTTIEDDSRKKRSLDTTLYFPSRVYHFFGMKESVVVENHLSAATQTPNCAIYIHNPLEAAILLPTCYDISKQQGVTDLYLRDATCHNSTPLQAPRLINPQSLYLYTCDLPVDYVRSLLKQLFGTGDSLQYLRLRWMDLSPYESLLDELLEDLVAHHEAQKGQRKLRLEMRGFRIINKPINLSEEFVKKWRKRCRGVESIDCIIRD